MQSKNGDDYTHWEEIHDMMLEFAKIRVTEALKQAGMKINVSYDNSFSVITAILNAYPPENIK